MTAISAFVVAIDPGRDKCGLAVIDADRRVLAREIVRTGELVVRAAAWARQFPGASLVMGQGTGGRKAREALRAAGIDPVPVREEGTTLAARERYFRDHPPHGWRRLLPTSLQSPPVPLDDYAAVVIAERYLAGLGRGVVE